MLCYVMLCYVCIYIYLTNYLRYGLGILDQSLDNMLETLGFDLAVSMEMRHVMSRRTNSSGLATS